jgi:hypothetical protein
MPRGLKAPHPLIYIIILFTNISNFLKWKFIYITTFSVGHWDAWDDSLCIVICEEKAPLSILTTSFMCLHFNMQEEEILQHTHANILLSTPERTMSWSGPHDEIVGH